MHVSLIIIPVMVYMLLLACLRRRDDRMIAEALVKTHIIVFTYIAVSTELLSTAGGISFPYILSAWLLLLAASLISLLRNLRMGNVVLPAFDDNSAHMMVLAGAIVGILAATAFAAVIYPPNTWDSMTYHMPRVMHWISHHGVAYYPTQIDRQNWEAPLAEFAILHLQVLTGGDHFANFVQWLSFMVLVSLSFLVAAELGLDRRGQLMAAVFTATLPMAILQASGTQTDLVVSAFVMSFALFMLRLRTRFSADNLLFAGASLGLALLAKGTAYVYGAAVGITLALPLMIDRRREAASLFKATSALLLVVVIALAFNSGHYWRNYRWYGEPLSTGNAQVRNGDHSLATLESNVLRNAALHLGTPYEHVNERLENGIKNLLGSKLNDPRTTWVGASFRIPFGTNDNTAGNLLHMLMIFPCAAFLLIAWLRGKHRELIWYSSGLVLSSLLFCWLLKWQPWNSRLHTPLFVMASPLLGVMVISGGRGKRVALLAGLALFLYSLPFALDSTSRPIVSLEWKYQDRDQLYFKNRPYLFADYIGAVKTLRHKNDRAIGLYMGEDDWEYPFWVLANHSTNRQGRATFRPVGVAHTPGLAGESDCLLPNVIATKPIGDWEHASSYREIFNSHYVSVFRKVENGAAPACVPENAR
jgi:hypothetical protein